MSAVDVWHCRCRSIPMWCLLLQSLVLMALCFPPASMCPKGCSCLRTDLPPLPAAASLPLNLPAHPHTHPHPHPPYPPHLSSASQHLQPVHGLNVTCSQSRLKEIPRDLPSDTVLLRLDRNHISAIPDRAFGGLRMLRELNLSSNALETLGDGAFSGLEASLQLLDLSHNRITTVAREAFSRLKARVVVEGNPWHCDCALQQALGGMAAHNHEAATRVLCRSTELLRHPLPDDEHYNVDADGQPYMVDADLCNLAKRTTDYAMLVTMFGWFAMVISYVVYYVRQNQEDARRHLEYLKSLPSKPKRADEAEDISTVV